MIDLIKKSMLAGIGAAVVSKEAAEKTLEEWVAKGKISTQEARDMAGKIVDQGRSEFEKTRGELSTLFDEALTKAHVVTRKDFETLEARVAALEAITAPESKKKS